MQDVVNLAFDQNLVRVILREGAPWFIGVDVCEALHLAKPENALSSLNDDERHTLSEGVIQDGRGSRARVVVSEPGVYRLVFRSRKPEAERFKRWLAHDVLPQLRRSGRYEAAGEAAPAVSASQDARDWPVIQKLQCVQLCARIYGRSRAEAMWRQVGLPHVPPPPPSAVDEAAICLRHLLDARTDDGQRVRDLLEVALDGDEAARAMLIASGIRPLPEQDAFVVANRHRWLQHVFGATVWNRPLGHMRVLRRLPGAVADGASRYGEAIVRGTLIPGIVLGEE